MQVKFNIIGMSCSACSARIEKVVSKIDGVKKVEVNLLTNSMIVQIEQKEKIQEIIEKVKKAGYGAEIFKENKKEEQKEDLKKMKKRLIISFAFLILLMYVSMGHMIKLLMPNLLHDFRVFSIIQIILVLPIIYLNRNYFINGFKNLIRKSPNMDSLIALGSTAAFVYGIYNTIQIFISPNIQTANHYAMNLYFESAGMIVTLITLGKYLEKRAKRKTTSAIEKLIDLSPKTATILKDGKEEKILTTEVKIGDILVIKPGETVPVDGKVIEGEAYFDESAITGESIEVKKKKEDKVITATINKNGNIKMIAEKVGQDTTLSQIIHLVEQASSSKAPIGKLADKISGIFVPIVILIAILSTIIWIILGKGLEFSLSIGIAVLVISCPCALGLATPVSIMVVTGKGAQKGILIKSAESLENGHLIDTIVFDKTGTITEGKTKVIDILNIEEKNNKEQLMKIVASIENKSEHPISRAIVNYAKEQNIKIEEVEEFENMSGKGIKAKFEDKIYYIGNEKLMLDNNIDIAILENEKEKFQKEAKTIIYIGTDKILGILTIRDTIKQNTKQVIEELKKRKIKTILLTGDNRQVADVIGNQIEIDEIISEVLPQEKDFEIKKLQEEGRFVAMVGDGINDSPALARANVGIAIGAGTDIAIEAADVVLVKNKINDVIDFIRLSKATIKNIKINLFWAFFYNAIGIPIAAGILYPTFGFTLNPMIAAAAMSLSSVCVVTNALRLRKFK